MEKDFVIPLHYQIKNDIHEKIKRGEIMIGDQLHPETELANFYGVSRPTIRQAILTLVNEGILVRKRGKGTYVAKPLITKDAQIFSTFAEDMFKHGIIQQSITLKKQEIEASQSISDDLMIPINEPVYEITRIRIGNGEKLVLRTSYIAKNRCPKLVDEDLDNEPLYQTIKRLSGLVPIGAVQSFRAISASKSEAKILEVETGFPLMLWEGIIYSQDGKPIEKVVSLHRGDRFKFFISQGRPNGSYKSPANSEEIGILF